MTWTKWVRPGYFGRQRDARVAHLNTQFGEGNWELRWVETVDKNDVKDVGLDFYSASKLCYEESYFQYLKDRKDDLSFITSFGECYDNAKTNVESGLDYSKQEAFSTHIQDIAVRNVLKRLGLHFKGPKDLLLQIRSSDSTGYRFGPGNVPFYDPTLITQPSKAPSWAKPGSVEDYWQSNKWIMINDIAMARVTGAA